MQIRKVLLVLFFSISVAPFASGDDSLDPAKNPQLRIEYRNGKPAWGLQEPNEHAPDPDLGYHNHPNSVVRHALRTQDAVVWDVHMTFDRWGNRVTPQSDMSRRKKALVFMGCSFVNGTGVSDRGTLPYFVAKEMPDYHVYNFAIGGSGTNMMLARLQEPETREIIREPNATFVYLPIDAHVGRANGFYMEASWMWATPDYEYDSQGNLVRSGSIKSAHPWRTLFYDGLRVLQSKFFPSYVFNLPRLRPSHHKYVCDLTIAMSKEVQTRFPGSKFLVIDHPMGRIDTNVINCLKEHQVPVVETESWPLEDDYKFSIDSHPTEKFNRNFAKVVAQEVKKLH